MHTSTSVTPHCVKQDKVTLTSSFWSRKLTMHERNEWNKEDPCTDMARVCMSCFIWSSSLTCVFLQYLFTPRVLINLASLPLGVSHNLASPDLISKPIYTVWLEVDHWLVTNIQSGALPVYSFTRVLPGGLPGFCQGFAGGFTRVLLGGYQGFTMHLRLDY